MSGNRHHLVSASDLVHLSVRYAKQISVFSISHTIFGRYHIEEAYTGVKLWLESSRWPTLLKSYNTKNDHWAFTVCFFNAFVNLMQVLIASPTHHRAHRSSIVCTQFAKTFAKVLWLCVSIGMYLSHPHHCYEKQIFRRAEEYFTQL